MVLSHCQALCCRTGRCIELRVCVRTHSGPSKLAGVLVLKWLSKVVVYFLSVHVTTQIRARVAREIPVNYAPARACVLSNRQLGSGLEVPFKNYFAQLAELHTVSHSAASPERGNMPAATRVKFNVLFVVAWYPTDPPVYPRCR